MVAKKKSSLAPKVRKLLEKALLEALKRHYGKSPSSRAKKKAPARKKKTPVRRKKAARKTAPRRRKRRT